MKDDIAAQELCELLARRQLPTGGWSALSCSSQASVESSALAYIVLPSDFASARQRATQFLLAMQSANGSWPSFAGDDKDGSWTTSLVLIALQDNIETIVHRFRGFRWLLQSAGKESHWLWKWKFLTTDRHVRFDPNKFGWPWIPQTNSWVVPTAFSILALNMLPGGCGFPNREHRLELGIQMLLDRACPGGGWNAGNGVVYGRRMTPHPDDTAVALLALLGRTKDTIVSASVDQLDRIAPDLNAPWSLAWSILGLTAHGRPVKSLVERLSCWPNLDQVEDTSTIAICCLALDYPRALARFGLVV